MIRRFTILRLSKDTLLSAVLFFILSFVFSLDTLSSFIITKELISSLIVGFFLSLTLYTTNYHFLIDVSGPNPSEEDQLVRQERVLKSTIDPARVIAKMKKMKSIEGFYHDEENEVMYAKVPWDHLSFGEKISIKYSLSTSGYEYTLSSKPSWWLTRYDYGKNLAHIKALEKLILNL